MSEPTLITIKIVAEISVTADFDGEVTIKVKPNKPDPEPLPPNPAKPQGEIGQ
jgi:hypothetical protein